jgi:multidrug transporter EmrE-like cation transporter
MSLAEFSRILAGVSLSALAQIALKAGMVSPQGKQLLQLPLSRMPLLVLGNYLLLTGLFLYFASMVVWLRVLATTEVSVAYPFVGVGFVFTMLLAWPLFGEAPTLAKLGGTAAIMFGIWLLARGNP